MFSSTSYHKGKKSWDKMLMQGQGSVSLSLCDFNQSRLLINFQIINVKVTETPFHSGADKPAPINIPVSGCRSGWYDIHGLIPSLPYCCCCCCHVNFSSGGSQMPSKSLFNSRGRWLLIACNGAGQKDSSQSVQGFIIVKECGGGIQTALMSAFTSPGKLT